MLPFFWARASGSPQRITMSLDGTWSVAESAGPDEMPRTYGHQGPVPGLTNLARPAFAGVDQFDSRELLHNRIRRGELPKSTVLPDGRGHTRNSAITSGTRARSARRSGSRSRS